MRKGSGIWMTRKDSTNNFLFNPSASAQPGKKKKKLSIDC